MSDDEDDEDDKDFRLVGSMKKTKRTTASAPMNSCAGSTLLETICPMKLDVRPTMQSMQMSSRPRTIRNVALRGAAP